MPETTCEVLRRELIDRVHRETDPARLEAAMRALAVAVAPVENIGSYRPVNADIRPVPASALAALDPHLLDEEVA